MPTRQYAPDGGRRGRHGRVRGKTETGFPRCVMAGYSPPMKILQQLEQRRQWAEDEQILLDQVRRIADTVIAPNAARYDRAEAFPQDSVDAVKSLGLNAIFVPEAYGGAPMSYRLYLAVVQTISEACASTGIIY